MGTEPTRGTRQQIVAAAEDVIMDRGLGGATTRAIAKKAGCAEGSIYRYFPDKHALLMEVFRGRFPVFLELMGSLPARAGTRTVRQNLEQVVAEALPFYRAVLPMAAGTLSEHKLLQKQRRFFEETRVGPIKPIELLADYVRREQLAGRVAPRTSPQHVARLILGACLAEAFLQEMHGPRVALGTDQRFARDLIRSLMEGLRPREEATA